MLSVLHMWNLHQAAELNCFTLTVRYDQWSLSLIIICWCLCQYLVYLSCGVCLPVSHTCFSVRQLDVLDRLGGGWGQWQHREDRESLDGRIQSKHFCHFQHAVAQWFDTGPRHWHNVLVWCLLWPHWEDSSQWNWTHGEFQFLVAESWYWEQWRLV